MVGEEHGSRAGDGFEAAGHAFLDQDEDPAVGVEEGPELLDVLFAEVVLF